MEEEEILDTPPVKVNFQYSLDEFIDAYRLHYTNLKRMKINVLIAVALLLLGLGLCIILGYSILKSLPIYFSVILVAILLVEFFLTPAKNFSRDPRLKEEHQLIFNPDKIIFALDKKTVSLTWRQYHRYVENAEFFLLYYANESFLILPRRAFISDEERYFINYLKTNVQKDK